MDALIQHVLDEISMDGETGSDVARLKSFINSFYDPQTGIPALSKTPQNTDDSFFSFVWETLLQQDDCVIAVFEPIASTSEGLLEGGLAKEDEGTPAGSGEEGGGEEGNVKGKGKEKAAPPSKAKKPARRKGKGALQAPTFSLRPLNEEEVNLGKDALVEKYGDALRITVSAESSWVAITGSHARPTAISPLVYQVLQLVSRTRGEGATVIEIGKSLGIDQRAAFHYVRSGVVTGIIKKFRDSAVKTSWTNRLVHRRYLHISVPWLAHLAQDEPDEDEDGDGEAVKDDDEERQPRQRAPVTLPHSTLWSNLPLIKRRILRVVRSAKEKGQSYVYHQNIAPLIGLVGCDKRHLRKLNTVITSMSDDGTLAKLLVPYEGLLGTSRAHCVKLSELADVPGGGSPGPVASTSQTWEQEDDAADDSLRALANISLERRMFDLLTEADAEGLTNRELADQLGGYNARSTEGTLSRFVRDGAPAHLADYSIHAVFETVGREKRTRYFLKAGYRRRCLRDGIVDPSVAEPDGDSELVGGWQKLEDGFYKDAADLDKFITKTRLASAGNGKKGEKSTAGLGRGRGGRGRRKPLVPGAPLTYYERRRREDEERKRLGLPPREKRPPTKGGRRPKNWVDSDAPEVKGEDADQFADADEGSGGAPQAAAGEQPVASQPPVPAKRKGRPPGKGKAKEKEKEKTEKKSAKGKGKGKAVPAPQSSSTPDVSTSVPPAASTSATEPPTPLAATYSSTSTKLPSVASPAKSAILGKRRATDAVEIPAKRRAGARNAASSPAPTPLLPTPSTPGPATPSVPSPVEPGSEIPSSVLGKRRPTFCVEIPSKRRATATSPGSAGDSPSIAVPPSLEPPHSPTTSSSPPPPPESIEVEDVPEPQPDPKVEEVVRRSRAPATKQATKQSFTALRRQADVLAFLEATGGICEGGISLGRDVSAWLKTQPGRLRTFSDDRTTRDLTMNALVERGVVKRTSVQLRGRRDLFYLPHITLDSAEMVSFIGKLADPDWGGWKDKERVVRPVGVAKGDDPSLSDTNEAIQNFFMRDYRVLGAKYGCLYGRFARARELHRFLIGIVAANPAGSEHVFSKGPGLPGVPTIIEDDVMKSTMPLYVFLRILPIPEWSPEFDAFIADPVNTSTPIRDLPPWVLQIVNPTNIQRRRAMVVVIQSLMDLSLLRPLLELPAAPGATNKSFGAPAHQRYVNATHWLLSPSAPIYAVADPAQELIAVAPLNTPEEVEAYWVDLADACLKPSNRNDPGQRPGIQSSEFPSTFAGSKAFAANLSSTTKWYEGYMLLEPQRTFLTKVFATKGFSINEANPDQLRVLASNLLAPVDVVVKYLQQLEGFRLDPTARPLVRRRNKMTLRVRRQAKSVPVGKPIITAARDALRTKAGEAVAQRHRDWQAAIDRFSSQHPGFVLEPRISEYLQKRFCASNRAQQISLRDVECELTLLLLNSQDGETDLSYRSIVPTAIHHAAALASDPFALPRAPVVRKRPPKERIAPRAPPPPKAPFEPSGTQIEFLSAAPRPVPVLMKGQRMPRNFFSDEQNELLLDATAIVKARAEAGKGRMAYGSLEQLFEGIPSSKLRQFSIRLVQRDEDPAYVERLKDAWAVVWEKKRTTGELPDPDPTSMTEFDLPAFVRCLRANIDKQALRMSGPRPQVRELVELPSLEVLEASSLFGEHDRSAQWASYWKHGTTAIIKEGDIAVIPFSCPSWERRAQVDHDLSMTTAVLKMLLVTPAKDYSEESGKDFIQPYESQLEIATQKLSDNSVISKVHSEIGRRVPGRNFVLGDKYLSSFEGVVSTRKANGALRVDSSLHGTDGDAGADEIWPLMVEDGEMMALIRLVSEDVLDVTVDTSASRELRDPSDYQTRQATDETIECAVQVGRARFVANKDREPISFPSLAPSKGATADPAQLDSALAAIRLALEDDSAQVTFDAIRRAGSAGVAYSTLARLVPQVDERALSAHVNAFVKSDRPLVFWAGDTTPVLVALHFLASWTVALATAPSNDFPTVEPRRVFPAVWIGVTGDAVPIMWEKAFRWVQGVLLSNAGVTVARIAERARGAELLSLGEVMLVLSALNGAGVAYAVEPEAVAEGQISLEDGVRDINWETARWFHDGRWYK